MFGRKGTHRRVVEHPDIKTGTGGPKPKRKDIAVRWPNGAEMPRQTRGLWLKWFERSK